MTLHDATAQPLQKTTSVNFCLHAAKHCPKKTLITTATQANNISQYMAMAENLDPMVQHG